MNVASDFQNQGPKLQIFILNKLLDFQKCHLQPFSKGKKAVSHLSGDNPRGNNGNA